MVEEKKGEDSLELEIIDRESLSNLYNVARGGDQFVSTAQDLAHVIFYCHEVLKWSPSTSNIEA